MVKPFWDKICRRNARYVCCPTCNLEKCAAWTDKCDAKQWYDKRIHEYEEQENETLQAIAEGIGGINR